MFHNDASIQVPVEPTVSTVGFSVRKKYKLRRDNGSEHSADLTVCRIAGFPACGCRTVRGTPAVRMRRRQECRRYSGLESLRYMQRRGGQANFSRPSGTESDVRPHPSPLPRGFALPTSFYEV